MKRKAMEIEKTKLDRHGGGGRGGYGGGGMAAPASAVALTIAADGRDGRRRRFDDGFDDRAGGSGVTAAWAAWTWAAARAADATPPPRPLARVPRRAWCSAGRESRNKFLESLCAEGEAVELESSLGRPSAAPGVPAVPMEGVSLQIEEKIHCMMKKDGGLEQMELQGTMMLEIRGGEEDAFIRVGVATGPNEGFQFKTHPNIDKALHASQGVLGLKDPNRPFPTGSPLGVLKWRYSTRDESKVPLSINCWPSVSGGESFVSIEYEATEDFDLHNVVISIPLPALRDPPQVNNVDGDFTYDSRGALHWEIQLVDKSNRSGSMEFVVPATNGDTFFPIDVDFTSNATYCDVKVDSVTRTTDGGAVKFFGESKLVCDGYQVA